MTILNCTKLNPDQFLNYLPLLIRTRRPAHLHGEPGVGKTSCVAEYCQENGIKFIPQILSQLQPGDLRIPYVDGLNYDTLDGDLKVKLELGEIHEAIAILNTVRNEQKISYGACPSFLPRTEEPTILLLDELSNAAPDVQVQAYQLILERRLGVDYHVPDNTYIMSAGNRPEHSSGAFEMGRALADRLCHFEIITDAEQWLMYGIRKKFHPVVLTFIKHKRGFLNRILTNTTAANPNDSSRAAEFVVTPSPRSWQFVSNTLYEAERLILEAQEFGYEIPPNYFDGVIKDVLPGLVGEQTVVELSHYLKFQQSLLPTEDYFSKADDEAWLKANAPRDEIPMCSLIISLISGCDDLSRYQKAIKIMTAVCSADSQAMREDTLSFGISLLAKRAGQHKLKDGKLASVPLARTPEFIKILPIIRKAAVL